MSSTRSDLLTTTPAFVNESLLGVTFIADYTKCVYVSQLKSYRHVLAIADGNEVVGRLAGVFAECDTLDQDSTIRIAPGGGMELLICFDAQHPFGVHEWKIHACQIYRDPAYLLIWVTRLRSLKIRTGEIEPMSYRDMIVATKEFVRMAALMFVMLVETILQITWILHATVNSVMVHAPRVINALMPLFLAILNALTKCVGGLYLLIAMMWRGRGEPVPVSQYQVEAPRYYRPPVGAIRDRHETN